MKYYGYLSSFLAVYRYGSLRKAANALDITQPAISKQLQSLEAKLNQKLFKQSGRGVKPTEYAHHLAASIAPHLDQLDTYLAQEDMSRVISISLDFDLLWSLSHDFFSKVQNCQLLIDNDASDRIQKVAQEEFDFAITRNIYHAKHVETLKLFDENHIIVGTSKWAYELDKYASKEKTYDDFTKLNWVISNEALYFLKEYCRVGFDCEFDITPAIRLDNLMGVRELVLKGAGVSILPYRLCKPYLDSGQLIQLHHAKAYPSYSVHLIYREGKLKNKQCYTIKDALVKHFSSHSFLK